MSDSEEQFAYAMQLVTSIALPMVLLNATKLKVLDIIAKAGPNVRLSAHEIASHLSISNQNAPEMLDRMLRLLASHSILTCSLRDHESKPVREYGLAPVAKHFLPNEDGVSLVPMLELHQDKVPVDTWFKVEEAVLEGGTPFDKVHGTSGFEYTGLDARFSEIFNKAMVETSIIVIKEVLNCYHGFNNLKSLVDIGGGLGITLNMVRSKYPKIKGINLDLPHVIQHAPQYPGIEHVGGDMFQNLPQGDAIFMKWVLHGWSDSNCIKLLKNCYKSLPEHGKVIVVDKILPVLPDTCSYTKCGTNQDTIMMTQTPGGKERTEDEFLALAKGAGFGGMRKTCKVCTFWVMEFYK
nr:caffeic acid 3-O-methyltransferase-like [Tanacetum cinerariifolium]